MHVRKMDEGRKEREEEKCTSMRGFLGWEGRGETAFGEEEENDLRGDSNSMGKISSDLVKERRGSEG